MSSIVRRHRPFILLCLFWCASADAGTVTVAVASNFADVAKEIAVAFEADTSHRVRVAAGSSGKLYAQIINGAPYDVFLSADAARPMTLEKDGFVEEGSRLTYAIGQLMIWSRDPSVGNDDCRKRLTTPGNAKIAIANPNLAPYGVAAREFLESEGLWAGLQSNLVIAENISQALHFAARGGASLGIIAGSQVAKLENTTCMQAIPADSHGPIEQQLVLLKRARDKVAARAFVTFMHTREVQSQIRDRGYRVSGDEP